MSIAAAEGTVTRAGCLLGSSAASSTRWSVWPPTHGS